MNNVRVAVGFLLLWSSSVLAQGVYFHDNVTAAATNVPVGAQAPVFSVPRAVISVFSDIACMIPQTAYSNPALTTVAPQPIMADARGRFSFYVAPGSYSYSASSQAGSSLGCFPFSTSSAPGTAGPPGTISAGGVDGGFVIGGIASSPAPVTQPNQFATKIYSDQCAHSAHEANVLCFGADNSGTVTPITSYSLSNMVLTVKAVNNYTAGQIVGFYGFATSTALNGLHGAVLPTGLSSSQFSVDVSYPNLASTLGSATTSAVLYGGSNYRQHQLVPASFSVTNNIATLTFSSAHGLTAGQDIYLFLNGGSVYYPGLHRNVSSSNLTATTLSVDLSLANASATESGSSSTDSTAAEQAAVASVGCKGTVYYPAGQYFDHGLAIGTSSSCNYVNFPIGSNSGMGVNVVGSGLNNTIVYNMSTREDGITHVARNGLSYQAFYTLSDISWIALNSYTQLTTAPLIDLVPPAAPTLTCAAGGSLTSGTSLTLTYAYPYWPNAPSSLLGSDGYFRAESQSSPSVTLSSTSGPCNGIMAPYSITVTAPDPTMGNNATPIATASRNFNAGWYLYLNNHRQSLPYPNGGTQVISSTSTFNGPTPEGYSLQPIQTGIRMLFSSDFLMRNFVVSNYPIGVQHSEAWQWSCVNGKATQDNIGWLFNNAGATAQGGVPNTANGCVGSGYTVGIEFDADTAFSWTGGSASASPNNVNSGAEVPLPAYSAGVSGAAIWFRSGAAQDVHFDGVDFEGSLPTLGTIVMGENATNQNPQNLTISNSQFSNDYPDSVQQKVTTVLYSFGGDMVFDNNSIGSYNPTSSHPLIYGKCCRLDWRMPTETSGGSNYSILSWMGQSIPWNQPDFYKFSHVYAAYGDLTWIGPEGVHTSGRLDSSDITVTSQKAKTGTNFACFDTNGKLVKSTTPCSGT